MSNKPSYLMDQVFGGKALPGFDSDDLNTKDRDKVEAQSGGQQMAQLVLPMPEHQRRVLGSVPTPEWLLKGEPRPAQIEALRRSYYGHWMKEGEDDPNTVGYRLVNNDGLGRTGPARGWGHFMEQRLGKTPVLLNEFELFRRDHGFKWCVVVAPQQFKPEWPDEADRFGLSCEAHLFSSDRRDDAERWVNRNRKHGGLIAVNYEALLYPANLAVIEQITGGESLLGWDESVSIKNSDGKLAKAALDLSKKFKVRRDLTGKPVVAGAHDLYMQLRAIGELDGVNPVGFKHRYCKMGGFQGKKPIGVKKEFLAELHSIITGCSFPARRATWMKTPGSDYAPRHLNMLPEQKVHYKRMEEEFITELARIVQDADGVPFEELIIIAADQITTKLLKLQQIASGFIIDERGVPHDIMPASKNPKLQEVKRMLTDEIDNKAIIFAHHTHSIDLLREALVDLRPAFIVGDAQARRFGVDVQSEKRRFNGDPSCRAVVGQSLAIRYGHTLMGSPGDPCLTEIFYENTYDLNTRSQCEERPQGKDQAGAISIYDFIAAPIDQSIIEALVAKEDVSAAAMNYARDTGLFGARS